MVAPARPVPSSPAGPPAQGRSASRSASDRRGDIEVLPENEVFGRLACYRPAGAVDAPCIARPRSHRRDSHRGRRRFSGQTRGGRYSWARYYHPGLQRFLGEDPFGLAAGFPNYYVYVGNNPISNNDPFGLATGGAGVQIAGASGGAAGSVTAAIVVDTSGQVGFALTVGGGGAGSSAIASGSAVLQLQGTTAATIQQLRGTGGVTSLSVQAPGGPYGTGIAGQAEFVKGRGYVGATGGVGVGLPGGEGFTLSGEVTQTWVWCIAFCSREQPPATRANMPPRLGGRKP